MKKVVSFLQLRKRFLLFSILRILSMVFGLCSNIIIVRKLDVEQFGVFSIALLVVNLITTFGFSWSSSSILYFGSKEKEKYGSINKTFWTRNIIIFISLFVATVMIVVFSDMIENYIGLDISFLILLWLYVSVIEDYLNQYFLAIKRQITSSMLSITAKILYIILILMLPFDVTSLIIIYIISHASVILYILGINREDIGNFEFDKSWFKKVLDFSLWQLFGFAGLYLLNFGDTAVVKHFLTNHEVGIYNAAYQLFNAVAGFSYIISSYYAANLSSYFSAGKQKKVKQFYYKERLYIFFTSIIAHALVMILSKPIIVTLYGNRYLDTIPIFNILMVGSLIKYLTVFYMLYYNTNGKHRIQQILNIFMAIFNVGLSIVFIKVFGLKGPALATIITLLLSLLFSFIYCEKRILRFIKTM